MLDHTCVVMCPKVSDRIANSGDPDQTPVGPNTLDHHGTLVSTVSVFCEDRVNQTNNNNVFI